MKTLTNERRNRLSASKSSVRNNAAATDPFEQRLLEHVELLYDVAVDLTQNARKAESITRRALCDAWHNRRELAADNQIKSRLLTYLRRAFLEERKRASSEYLLRKLIAALDLPESGAPV